MSNAVLQIGDANFASRLLGWHDVHGRKDLPWQQNITPYRVWVSEIMLQQTQVASVIDYYQRFMQRFPTVDVLANAPVDEVLHYWSGLGYYARARNLHKTAVIVHEQFGGTFPNELDAMNALPGIGQSTAAAILSIASGQSHAILDGNVKRVLARRYCVQGWPGKTSVANQLWQYAHELTPRKRTAQYTQAIMDLGATLCSRTKPKCEQCPVMGDCKAYKNNAVTDYPHAKPKQAKPERKIRVWVMEDAQGRVLLQKRPSKGIWGGLWSFPEQAVDEAKQSWLEKQGLSDSSYKELAAFRHTFSHFHLRIEPVHVRFEHTPELEMSDYKWYNAHCDRLGLAAPVQKLLTAIQHR